MNELDVNDDVLITNVRHKELIDKARDSLSSVLKDLDCNVPIDMISIEIQNAVQYLGEITGETVSEDVIGGIFKKFCLGK